VWWVPGRCDKHPAGVMSAWQAWWTPSRCDECLAGVMNAQQMWWVPGRCDECLASMMNAQQVWWVPGRRDECPAGVMSAWQVWWTPSRCDECLAGMMNAQQVWWVPSRFNEHWKFFQLKKRNVCFFLGYCGQIVHKSEANLQFARPEEHLHRSGFRWRVDNSCWDEVLSVEVDSVCWSPSSRMCS